MITESEKTATTSKAGTNQLVVFVEQQALDLAPIAGADTYDLAHGQDDYEDDMTEAEEASEFGDLVQDKSPMQIHLQAVHRRLKEETNSIAAAMEKSLFKFLMENNWCIPAYSAEFIYRKINIAHSFSETAYMYYKDIVVWLPDLKFNVMPPCPNGCKNQCRPHAWRDNHFGRKVVALYGHYFVTSRRSKCMACKTLVLTQKRPAGGAKNKGSNVVEKISLQYTSMVYNK
jgi:hypothetical protein